MLYLSSAGLATVEVHGPLHLYNLMKPSTISSLICATSKLVWCRHYIIFVRLLMREMFLVLVNVFERISYLSYLPPVSQFYIHVLLVSKQGSDRATAHPTFAKEGELPQGSYISHKRVGYFCHLFQHCCHPLIFLFNTCIALVGAHDRIAKIRMSECPMFKFLWDFENRQNWF